MEQLFFILSQLQISLHTHSLAHRVYIATMFKYVAKGKQTFGLLAENWVTPVSYTHLSSLVPQKLREIPVEKDCSVRYSPLEGAVTAQLDEYQRLFTKTPLPGYEEVMV